MNDDFIKQHKQRPDPHFVENLYQKLERTNQRSLFTMTKNIRGWKTALAALLIVLIFTFSFVPQARAALLSIFSFNGVEVSVDSETNELIVTGNTDAVIYQDADSVWIEGEDGATLAGFGNVETETVNMTDLQTSYPDFVLPTQLPDGYTLVDEANIADGVIIVSWENSSGEAISYMWGTPSFEGMGFPEGTMNVGEVVFLDDGEVDLSDLPEEVQQQIAELNQPFHTIPSMDGGLDVMLSTEIDGVTVQVIATDETISEATLQAVLP